MPLHNFGVVLQNPEWTIFRSAQPDALGFRDLRDHLNVDVSYKLSRDHEFSNATERALFEPNEVILDPFEEVFRTGDLDRVIAAAQAIYDCTWDKRSVLIHCSHGRDRTGLISAAVQMLIGAWPLQLALDERKAFGVAGLIAVVDEPDHHILKALEQRIQAGLVLTIPPELPLEESPLPPDSLEADQAEPSPNSP